jgi:hypothetical protein
MNTKFCVISIFILTSCDLIDQNHFEVEKQLRPYVDSFYAESNKRGRHIQHENLMISFSPLNGLAGESMDFTTIPTIHIDPTFFNKYSKANAFSYIEYIIFHEMGHALLHRDHKDAYTIMTSNNKLLREYSNNTQTRTLLIDELFGVKEISISLKCNYEKIDTLIALDCISQSKSVNI